MNESKNSKPVPDFLLAKIDGINEANDALTKLFRIICYDLDVGPEEWMHLMDVYLDKFDGKGKRRSVSERSTEKNNLKRQLESNSMTFKVFQRALQFLGDYDATFKVVLKNRRTGEEYEQSIRLINDVSDLVIANKTVPMKQVKSADVDLMPKKKGKTGTRHSLVNPTG